MIISHPLPFFSDVASPDLRPCPPSSIKPVPAPALISLAPVVARLHEEWIHLGFPWPLLPTSEPHFQLRFLVSCKPIWTGLWSPVEFKNCISAHLFVSVWALTMVCLTNSYRRCSVVSFSIWCNCCSSYFTIMVGNLDLGSKFWSASYDLSDLEQVI